MTAIIIIGIIFFIIYTTTKKKQPVQQRTKVTNSNDSRKTEQKMKVEVDQNIPKSFKNENSVNQNPINPQVIIENKNIEQTELIQRPVLNTNNFESKIEIRNIFDTEASVVKELSNEVGKIAKLAGQTGNGLCRRHVWNPAIARQNGRPARDHPAAPLHARTLVSKPAITGL